MATATPDSQRETERDTTADTFEPFHDIAPDNNPILTFRALLLGILCGTLVNASNIYLGLKAGWTTSANILGTIIGFAVLKHWSKSSFSSHDFGPHENNIVQTAATAAGGLSHVFVSAVPALYQLGLLETPIKDFFRIVTLAAIGGYFGLLPVAPLREFFLVNVARELNLIFPSSSAAAITIRSMHQAVEGAALAQRKLYAMVYAFGAALLLRVASQYAMCILWDWHPFTWMINSGIAVDLATSLESWGWFIEWTPAFIGSGMLVGLNVAVSFLAGSVLAWGIIGPYLVHHGLAFGRPMSNDLQWTNLMSYASLSSESATADRPSPRYWLLWPGVMCMIAISMTELACQWRVFWTLIRIGYTALVRYALRREYKYTALEEKHGSDTIKTWMWLPGLLVVIVGACPLLKSQFDMSIAETLLALSLAFMLSLLAIQATGATDTTPLGTLSKVSQVALGSTTHQSIIATSQRLSLLGGALTNIGASQACDLMGDFRVGFLLKTPPRHQYTAQLLGTLIATFLSPLIFMVFAAAYPCILSQDTAAASTNKCEFDAPAVSAWRAVALISTEPILPIPPSSLTFSIAMSITGIVAVLIRHYVWTGKRAGMRAYYPNLMILALAFTLPSSQYGIAMLIGAVGAGVWRRRRRARGSFEAFRYAVAAGFMAGEGVGGTVNAGLAVLGVGGDGVGIGAGCPAGRC